MKTEKEMAEVMLGFADGQKVQAARKDLDDWENSHLPIWNWSDYDYRLKTKTIEELADEYANERIAYGSVVSLAFLAGARAQRELDE